MSLKREALTRVRALLAARRRRDPPLFRGHDVLLLQAGAEFFPALEAEIDAARHSVQLETYIFNDDASGRRIAAALARAATRGVRVQIVIDGFGTGIPRGGLIPFLVRENIETRVFRPLPRWRFERQALRRLHRKLALIDEHTAFVGGINLIDDHEDLFHRKLDAPRLDFALRVKGPLLAPLLLAMRRIWRRSQPIHWPSMRAKAAAPAPSPLPPAIASISLPGGTGPRRMHSDVQAALVERDNWRHRRTIERAYLKAIGRARQEVLIACAYFFPGVRFRRALIAAARRGVRVRLLLQGRIEHRLAHFGTLALYDELLRAGVEVIEYQPSFLHAKLALADQWLTVGSSNIDPFSLLLAREANIVARDAGLAAELRASIERAIAEGGVHVHLAQVQRRPWWLRLVTLAAYLLLRVGVAISGRGLRY